jgi:hypothetical protein
MASNDKTAKLRGSLLITPTGVSSYTDLIDILMETGTFDTKVQGSFTLAAAASASVVVPLASYGIDTAAHFIYVKARDLVTGGAKTIALRLLQATAAVNGISATATCTALGTDFFFVTSENPKITNMRMTVQDVGNDVEITWIVGGS